MLEFDTAFNNKDIKSVLSFYEENALLVIEPGRLAKGLSEISEFFEFAFKMNIKQNK